MRGATSTGSWLECVQHVGRHGLGHLEEEPRRGDLRLDLAAPVGGRAPHRPGSAVDDGAGRDDGGHDVDRLRPHDERDAPPPGDGRGQLGVDADAEGSGDGDRRGEEGGERPVHGVADRFEDGDRDERAHGVPTAREGIGGRPVDRVLRWRARHRPAPPDRRQRVEHRLGWPAAVVDQLEGDPARRCRRGRAQLAADVRLRDPLHA